MHSKKLIVAALVAAGLAAPASALTFTEGASVIVGEGVGAPGDLSVYTVEVLPGVDSLYGFGVTSPDTTALRIGPPVIGPTFPFGDADAFGPAAYDGATNFDFWTGWIIEQAEWSSFEPLKGFGVVAAGTTLEDLFGPWAFGGDAVNWFQIEDAAPAAPDTTVEGFFFDGTPNSTALALLLDGQGAVTTDRFDLAGAPGGPGGDDAAVPLPGALALLVGALAGLGALRARRPG